MIHSLKYYCLGLRTRTLEILPFLIYCGIFESSKKLTIRHVSLPSVLLSFKVINDHLFILCGPLTVALRIKLMCFLYYHLCPMMERLLSS